MEGGWQSGPTTEEALIHISACGSMHGGCSHGHPLAAQECTVSDAWGCTGHLSANKEVGKKAIHLFYLI